MTDNEARERMMLYMFMTAVERRSSIPPSLTRFIAVSITREHDR